ncbi:hypothetical protein SCCGRSA3_01041 [Marine Group I thaumarchaeote SCGC RSA3]|uniref:Uncharacterized protein n=2 Tax=Marine Group I TaxID=905826 RepID=A0A087RT51_9ARCH|nr:hypothetical protein AAA799D11_00598 [Marine Group I thaumarchaeote SCGC AAA799-D11]KFM18708.1 hypothetical protein SCCGRSA3_01041 [Marine Group I thaumarchaeote SCGC RSA3]
MNVGKTIVQKRLDELILLKSQNDEKIIQLDTEAKTLRKKLSLDSY